MVCWRNYQSRRIRHRWTCRASDFRPAPFHHSQIYVANLGATMSAPVSVCMITRGDPHIVAALESIHQFVAEIVVVITSSTDLASLQTLKQLSLNCPLVLQTMDSCNDEQGNIIDFSAARNYSLSLATQPWVMWLDSD